MCRQCWDSYGRPSRTSPEIERMVELVGLIYDESPVGIPFHVQLDDWNIDSDVLAASHNREEVDEVYQQTCSDEPHSAGFWAAVDDLIALWPKLTVADRASALAKASGYL